MKKGILIGRKTGQDTGEALTKELPYAEAREKHKQANSSTADWPPGIDTITLCVTFGSTIEKHVVASREPKPEAESKKVKASKVKTAVVSALVALAALALPVLAQQDITTQLGATTITTNTADSQVFRWKTDDVLFLQATMTATNGGTSNVVFSIDSSLDGVAWDEAVTTVTMACNGTNAITEIDRTTNTAGGLYWRIGKTSTLQTNPVVLTRVHYLLVAP